MRTHMQITVMKCPAKIIEVDAMNVSYQIRTVRGKPVFAYDSLIRAQEEKAKAEKRIGCRMQIVRVTYQEEVLDA